MGLRNLEREDELGYDNERYDEGTKREKISQDMIAKDRITVLREKISQKTIVSDRIKELREKR